MYNTEYGIYYRASLLNYKSAMMQYYIENGDKEISQYSIATRNWNNNLSATIYRWNITWAHCWDVCVAPGTLLALSELQNTSAGFPEINRHNVRNGEPSSNWQRAICFTVSPKNYMKEKKMWALYKNELRW